MRDTFLRCCLSIGALQKPENIECRIIGQQTVGDRDLFLGEVAAMHVDEDKLNADDSLLSEKLDMLVYITGEYWSIEKRLGPLGFCRN